MLTQFPTPIPADACACCEGEARGWTSYYSRPATMCATHFMEWVDEKSDWN